MPRKKAQIQISCARCKIKFWVAQHKKKQKYCSTKCAYANNVGGRIIKPNAEQAQFNYKSKQKRVAAPSPTEDEVQSAVDEYLKKGGKITKHQPQPELKLVDKNRKPKDELLFVRNLLKRIEESKYKDI